LNIISRGIRR